MYKKKILAFATFLVITLVTAGCYSTESGNTKIVDASLTMQLKKGKTTEQQAIALLGQPTSSTDLPDGGQSISYSYTKSEGKYFVYYTSVHSLIKTLTLTFNKDGILQGKSWTQNESGGAG
jgi:outer membrane protein assembly factor BamE (lipoprotein component of BamABCDE complex)